MALPLNLITIVRLLSPTKTNKYILYIFGKKKDVAFQIS